MFYITKNQKYIFAVIAVILIIVSGTIYIRQEKTKATEISLTEAAVKEENVETAAASQEEMEAIEEISVYICGYVNDPGVIKATVGTRLDEAISMAGGAKGEADLTAVNLAYRLADEDMVYIPKKGEKSQGASKNIGVSTIKNTADNKNGKININTADENELDTLAGIGPATAGAIIQYRSNNGSFKTIEDIKNVKGIGDSKFNSIKDSITVE